jgi:hypoxanthine phosphoribosyltransferase
MNLPFNTSHVGSKIANEIKEEKIKIYESGYNEPDVINFINKFYKKILIPPNSLIITVPSTSRKNTIPIIFANRIKQDNPTCTIVHDGIETTHFIEAKKSLKNRNNNTINFYFTDKEKILKVSKNKSVFICDDITSTGESMINLKSKLLEIGIEVKGYINLVCGDKAYASKRDLERLYERLEPYTENKKELKEDINDCFNGYLRRKMYRIEQNIKKGNESNYINSIKESANNQRKFNLVQRDNGQNETVKRNFRLGI